MRAYLSTAITGCALLGAWSFGQTVAPQAQSPAALGSNVATEWPAYFTKVMCVGDSNTHGFAHPSYRYPLWFMLNQHGGLVDFVGTNFTVFAEDGTTYPDIALYPHYYTRFDRAHQGYTGIEIEGILAELPLAVHLERPDVCLVVIGTNDIGRDGAFGVSQALAGISDTIFQIRRQAPATTFFVGTLPPIGPGTIYFNNSAFIDDFNNQLPALLANLDNPTSRSLLVDTGGSIDVATGLLQDGIHVNPVGMQAWAATLYPEVRKAMRGDFRPPFQPNVVFNNTRFESLGLADGVFSDTPLADWVYPKITNIGVGIWNPDELSYTGAGLGGTPMGADGDEVLSLENAGGAPDLAWVTQTLTTTFNEDTVYTLTASVGQRLLTNTRGSTDYGGYEFQMLVGNQVVARTVNLVSPPPGSFVQDLLTVDSNLYNRALVGMPISARVRMTYPIPGAATDFDSFNLVAN